MSQQIKITGLGSSGEGVGKAVGSEELGVRNEDDKSQRLTPNSKLLTFFVDGALPDEIVDAELVTVKKNYVVGKLLEVIKQSPDRVEPFCPLYESCGGCQLQHMSYPAQLKWKRQQVVDAIERIGKLSGVKIFETLGMENPLRYRNKMQFPVGRNKVQTRKEISASSDDLPNKQDATSRCPVGRNKVQTRKEISASSNDLPNKQDATSRCPVGRNKVQTRKEISASSNDLPNKQDATSRCPVGHDGKNLRIGCYARGSHKIIDAPSCLIQNAGNDKILAAVRKVAEKFHLQPYDEDTHKGFLRHVMGRVGCDGELMVVLVTAKEHFPAAKNFCRALLKELPEITSIQQNIQTFHNNVILGRDTKILYGKPTIHDKIGALKFNISARSFFQVNTAQAEVLYNTALNFCELHGGETIIDAYCGTGTISLFLARRARKVFGVEVVSSAVADAKKNARENNIRNVEFIVGDAVKVLPRLADIVKFPDVIVVDPPRAGCDKKVLETFAAMEPDKIIYVSCNPATLARDLKILDELGYVTKKIQPVDMFPFTSHVESVAQIFKR